MAARSGANTGGVCEECDGGAVGEFIVVMGASRTLKRRLCATCRHSMARLAPVTNVRPVIEDGSGGGR